MPLIPSVLNERPPTPDPFWDEAIRFLTREREENNYTPPPEGHPPGVWGPFDPWTGEHLMPGGPGIPELVWPGPPSPGCEDTPMDWVLMEGWGQPNDDRLLYMTGDE